MLKDIEQHSSSRVYEVSPASPLADQLTSISRAVLTNATYASPQTPAQTADNLEDEELHVTPPKLVPAQTLRKRSSRQLPVLEAADATLP
jgi:hypothetical protein